MNWDYEGKGCAAERRMKGMLNGRNIPFPHSRLRGRELSSDLQDALVRPAYQNYFSVLI